MNYLEIDAAAIRSHLPQSATPPTDADDLFVLYSILLRAKGVAVTASDVHDAWSAWMANRDPAHESIRPFDDLAPDVQAQDHAYAEAIRAAARERGASEPGSSSQT